MAAGGGRWLGPWDAPVKSALQIYSIVRSFRLCYKYSRSMVCAYCVPFTSAKSYRNSVGMGGEAFKSRERQAPLFKTQMFPCLAKWVGVLRSTPHGDAKKTLLWSPATSKDLISSAESELPEAGILPEPILSLASPSDVTYYSTASPLVLVRLYNTAV